MTACQQFYHAEAEEQCPQPPKEASKGFIDEFTVLGRRCYPTNGSSGALKADSRV
jgi:hypothetical protein